MMTDVENTPLLRQSEEGDAGSPWRNRVIAAVGVVSALAVAGVALKPQIIKQSELWESNVDADGWYIYKVAYAGRSGTTEELLSFMTDYSGGANCEAVNLGCDGYKITCDYPSNGDKQLHYVVAPVLPSNAVDDDQLGVDGWIDIAMQSFGDMSTFSPMMHDKLQLWTHGLLKQADLLQSGGYKMMKRLSVSSDGSQQLGHVLVPVGGKIWEFVGQLDAEVGKEHGFVAWAKEECPKAHEIDETNLSYLMTNPSSYNSWMAASVALGTSPDHESLNEYISYLTDTTGAIKTTYEDEYCEVKSFHYLNKWEEENGGSTGSNIYYKLVHNRYYQDIVVNGVRGMDVKTTVEEWQNYIGKVHERYLARPEDGNSEHRWRGWDHYLDQHIGIKYVGTSDLNDDTTKEATNMQAKCLIQAEKLNEKFLAGKTWVGKRFLQTDGDHYYTGHSSCSMSLEFNTECHYGEEGATDVCTCIPENSDNLAIEKYGAKYSECDEIYEEMDGHDSTTGPWDGDTWEGKPARK